MLAIARYHIDHNGWNDLGYNFVVDRYGQVFEGRAGGVDLAIVGAQAQGYNSVSTGVACLGTFTAEAWTEEGMEAVAHLIGWKLSLHAVPVAGEVTVTSAGGEANRYPAGTRGHLPAHLRPPRRQQRRSAPATSSTASSRTCAPAPAGTPPPPPG